MPADDDSGAGRGWTGWFGRLTGASAADGGAGPAAPTAAGRLGVPPDVALLDAVISAMPDPIVVLDRDGRVMAFNAEAAALAPALRRGEPALIALRTPELVEAIRSAGAGRSQR